MRSGMRMNWANVAHVTLASTSFVVTVVAAITATSELGKNAGKTLIESIRRGAVQEVKVDERGAAFKLFDDLKVMRDDVLFVLKSADDPCGVVKTLDCRGISGEKVRPFVEAAITYRQFESSSSSSWRSLWVALGALFVSCCSMGISYLNYRRK